MLKIAFCQHSTHTRHFDDQLSQWAKKMKYNWLIRNIDMHTHMHTRKRTHTHTHTHAHTHARTHTHTHT